MLLFSSLSDAKNAFSYISTEENHLLLQMAINSTMATIPDWAIYSPRRLTFTTIILLQAFLFRFPTHSHPLFPAFFPPLIQRTWLTPSVISLNPIMHQRKKLSQDWPGLPTKDLFESHMIKTKLPCQNGIIATVSSLLGVPQCYSLACTRRLFVRARRTWSLLICMIWRMILILRSPPRRYFKYLGILFSSLLGLNIQLCHIILLEYMQTVFFFPQSDTALEGFSKFCRFFWKVQKFCIAYIKSRNIVINH